MFYCEWNRLAASECFTYVFHLFHYANSHDTRFNPHTHISKTEKPSKVCFGRSSVWTTSGQPSPATWWNNDFRDVRLFQVKHISRNTQTHTLCVFGVCALLGPNEEVPSFQPYPSVMPSCDFVSSSFCLCGALIDRANRNRITQMCAVAVLALCGETP